MQEYTAKSLQEFLENNKDRNTDFISELLLFEKHIDKSEKESVFLIYLNLCKAFSINKDLENALFYANLAEKRMWKMPDKGKADLLFEKGHIYARLGDEKKSKELFTKHFYFNGKNNSVLYHLNKSCEKQTGIFQISSMPLYSFRHITKYVISDLIKEEITLIDSELFNDPFDTLLFNYLDYRKNAIKEKSGYDINPLRDAYKYIKIRCFVKDKIDTKLDTKRAIQNILMWSHYANSHKGICIRYKFNHKEIDKYRTKFKFSNWLEVDYKSDIDLESIESRSMELLFATKNECWNYENEVRLIHFDPKCKKKIKKIPLKEIGSKVEAIFFGCKCNDKDKTRIKEIFKDRQDVEFFEFNKNPEIIWSEVYKLDPEDEARFKKLHSDCYCASAKI